jgi:hypothetical protein
LALRIETFRKLNIFQHTSRLRVGSDITREVGPERAPDDISDDVDTVRSPDIAAVVRNNMVVVKDNTVDTTGAESA